MFCTNCGERLEEGAVFCTNCGSKVELEVEPEMEAELKPEPQPQPEPQPAAQASPEPVTPERTDAADRAFPTKAVAIGVACAAAVLAAIILVPRVMGAMGASGAQDSSAVVYVAPADGAGEDAEGAAADDEDADDTSRAAARSSVSDYSWEELSAIGRQIGAAKSRTDAYELARTYNLLNADGSISRSAITLELKDGTRIPMRIIGIYHDEAADGTGRAGLTLMAASSAGDRKYHGAHTVTGGWQASDMRAYLNEDFLNLLPADVAEAIVPVVKLTNNTGKTLSTSSVTKTTDSVFLPSVVEVCGPLSWEYHTDPANSGAYNAVFSAEGTQYELFGEQGVTDAERANGVLSLGGTWWMRSVAPSTSRGRWVDAKGDPTCFGDADDVRGVMIAFCL